MIIPDQATLELDKAEAPDWCSDALPYTLAEVRLGQARVVVYKSTDRIMHIYVEAGALAERAEIPLEAGEQAPLKLTILWDQEGVRLRLGERQPIRLPWRSSPLPLRPRGGGHHE